MSTKEQSPMTEKESVRWRVANAHIDPDKHINPFSIYLMQ